MARFGDLLFKNRNFSLFWISQLISTFGERMNQMALIALVYVRAPGSAIALAKFTTLTVIPVFLIGPVAGAWVDRWNRKDVMIISDIIRGLLALTIPLFLLLGSVVPIYLVIFLIFSTTRFFFSSKMGIIPDLVSKDRLLMANSLIETTRTIGTAVGVVVAGIIVNVKHIGPTGGFFIYSLCFFISALLIGMIARRDFLSHVKKDLLVAKEALEKSIRRSIFEDIKEGIRFMLKFSDMRFIVAVFSFLMAGIGAIYCIIIVFIQQTFGTPTRDLGILILFLALGLFSGSLLYGRFGQKIPKKRAIFSSFIASGIAVILVALIVKNWPSLYSAAPSFFALGFSISPITVSVYTLAHEIMPANVRSKVFSSLEAVIHLAFLIFMLLSSVASRFVGITQILITVGVVFSVGGFTGFALQTRKRRTS